MVGHFRVAEKGCTVSMVGHFRVARKNILEKTQNQNLIK